MAPTLLFITGVMAGLIAGFILTFPTSLLAILKGLAMTIQQTEAAKNIGQIQAQAVELHLGLPARATQLWF
ncbi:hypothetical protein [Synechococcus sp. WH 8016]|uniref:hypothetical protein n=1 Tax=Synechococcus sp. WH 8016 TaxID=166318 RepID=UPI00022D8DF3|nr:hypothetical protein [Synechococcus sp. WH 8016]EHA63581.1 hypothetical protein Syn8016DRAFT_0622 [Synechococcus sp. WH 8016]